MEGEKLKGEKPFLLRGRGCVCTYGIWMIKEVKSRPLEADRTPHESIRFVPSRYRRPPWGLALICLSQSAKQNTPVAKIIECWMLKENSFEWRKIFCSTHLPPMTLSSLSPTSVPLRMPKHALPYFWYERERQQCSWSISVCIRGYVSVHWDDVGTYRNDKVILRRHLQERSPPVNEVQNQGREILPEIERRPERFSSSPAER